MMRYNGRRGRVQSRSESRVGSSVLADVALLLIPVAIVVAASYPALAAGAALGAGAAYGIRRARDALARSQKRPAPVPEELADATPTVTSD